ncbi:MAG: RES family NAD+ phosphorylase [bacterium]
MPERTPAGGTPVVSLTPSPDAPLPVRRVVWRNAVRIIPSVFPPANLFERVAAPEHLDAVQAIESAFNPRLRDASGELSLVARGDRVLGPGAGYIMAPFTHVSPDGSRFSNGTYGVFYAAQRETTAIAETRYHRERFMRATKEARCELDMRVLGVTVQAPLHDLRGMRSVLPDIYRLDDYTASQLLGGALRAGGSNGVVYDSVRHDSGKCVGIFRPRLVSQCLDRKHLRYIWDGSRITDVLEVKRVPP